MQRLRSTTLDFLIFFVNVFRSLIELNHVGYQGPNATANSEHQIPFHR